MGILLWIIVGLIAGAIAYAVLGRRGSILSSLVVGLIGALVGGKLAEIFRLHVTGGFIDQLIVSTIGAILLLVIWRAIRK
ncbi:GlsB/YeaQ/YmgE family stress response membrane protein [Breoghania sp. L-A4]|uniref:GlsB/YeaQ/YmgE family stress response membrane protein n=1 Tax=Breoghania sp. L-A4 TaxID=2304600 RepID=UPI000E35877F|nr:GlsB/YeaQ/YmgE family stress response membrane protein [Breoghania sp. L-A4]AXS42565.1 GlsB/YeaQ/YmgE family stress response membrane protein [Breoghania sp. L-A4]